MERVTSLENILQSELQLAHVESGPALEARSAGEVANLAEQGRRLRVVTAPVHVRGSQRDMVQDVEPFKTKLKALPLREGEVLDGREVHIPNPGTCKNVAPHVAELSRFHVGEARAVKP